MLVGIINGTTNDFGLTVVPDGSALYFNSDRDPGGFHLYISKLGAGGMFEPPTLVPGLETVVASMPTVRDDQLSIFFESSGDIFEAHRDSPDEAFGSPTLITELNTAETDRPSWISADGCVLYLDSGDFTTGNTTMLVATRPL